MRAVEGAGLIYCSFNGGVDFQINRSVSRRVQHLRKCHTLASTVSDAMVQTKTTSEAAMGCTAIHGHHGTPALLSSCIILLVSITQFVAHGSAFIVNNSPRLYSRYHHYQQQQLLQGYLRTRSNSNSRCLSVAYRGVGGVGCVMMSATSSREGTCGGHIVRVDEEGHAAAEALVNK